MGRHETLKEQKAPLTPFVMPQYKLAAEEEAAQLDAEAEVSAAVRRNIQRASNYVLGVVLFSVSLFFAGMSTRLTEPRLRRFALGVGCRCCSERSSGWPPSRSASPSREYSRLPRATNSVHRVNTRGDESER